MDLFCQKCDATLAKRREAHGVVYTDTDYGREECPADGDEHVPTTTVPRD